MKRIVICIVSYNQERVIGRTLESILNQKDWGLFRIIVSDDCSKDRTWDILQEYKEKYPEILDIHRNDHNLGIYGNVAQSNTYLPSDYDLVCDLAGDDALCDGYFKALQEFIRKKNIDTSKAVGIYSDWKAVSPDGIEKVMTQEKAISGINLWSLKIRDKICGRSLMTTKSVRDQYEPILRGKGLSLTETHYDSQPHLNITKAFYLPFIASVYYTGIGVSTKLADKRKSDYYTVQSAETWNYCMNHIATSTYDKHYINYRLLLATFYSEPSLKILLRMFHHYVKGQLPNDKESVKHTIILFLRFFFYMFKKKN